MHFLIRMVCPIYIRRGSAEGVFLDETAFLLPYSYSAQDAVGGDFDGDGIFDFAVYNGLKVTVWFGKGGGAFGGSVEFDWYANLIPGLGQLLSGDYDGDGKDELGLYSPSGDGCFYFRSYRLASFSSEYRHCWSKSNSSKAISGDFNGDGMWDIGLYNPNRLGNIYIKYGDNQYLFNGQTATHYGRYDNAEAFSGDFNGDGVTDFGVRNANDDGKLEYRFSNGNGAFTEGKQVWYWSKNGILVTGKYP
ncbi:FG-GAP repeat domain-containing protein [Microbulbifer sp. SSSA008]|uniref:FG-GAP repeat domain-containing protein n=1 Tax=Microbulbifer sp. SSSA008 TaxID=3243380 RepID=UPI004039246B